MVDTSKVELAIAGIGERLRACRMDAKLAQHELGEMAGTNQAVVQKIENGSSLRPRVLEELAKALNINPAWLQFGEPYAQKKRPKGW